MTRVVGMLLVKNEERYLPATLAHAATYCDELVILDDGSTDATPDICRACPKVSVYEYQTLPFHEGRSRNRLLEMALARDPSWIVALDADEIFDDRIREVLPHYLSDKQTGRAFAVPIYHLWRGTTHFRVDHPWGGQQRFKILRVEPGMRFADVQFHVPNLPINWGADTVRFLPLRLKHYGYSDYERCQQRYQFYTEQDTVKDPAMIGAADYRHLIDESTLELVEWREDEPYQTNLAQKRTPAVRPLTSIVIPVHNQYDLTRRCLDSLKRNTPEPHEIIVVDNGSDKDTARRLERTKGITYLRNKTNLGFAAATNQGIRAAKGEYVCLLNNDTSVCEGWLSRMIRAAESDPRIGLVGPRTNRASGSQVVGDGHYQTVDGQEMWARHLGRAFAGQTEETQRLVGFCLLVKREVFQRIGLLSEDFGQGNYEDDWLCWQARNAGYRLVIAQDAYVHHEQSATFRALNVDYGQLMETNRVTFEKKVAQAKGLQLVASR